MGHERAIDYVTRAIIPKQEEIDRGFKECCYYNIVLASDSLNDSQYNDFTSFYFVKQSNSDECDFVLLDASTLTEYALNDDTYGEFNDFGDYSTQPNLKTYKIEWKKVLSVLGVGSYRIRKDLTVSGVPSQISSNTYTLRRYSTVEADKTVRVDSVYNSYINHLGVDFSGTDYTTSLRTKGFFGNRKPRYTIENNIRRSTYAKEPYLMTNEYEYVYQTGILPDCVTSEIFDFMLWGDEIFVSDYNSVNHSYNYTLFPIDLFGSEDPNYINRTRKAVINLKFKDRFNNQRKLKC